MRERRSCYAAAAPLAGTAADGQTTRHAWQISMLLQSCAVEETSPELAEQLDRVLSGDPARRTFWSGRNARLRVAARHAGAAGSPGLYFREISKESGLPLQPDKKTVMVRLLGLGGETDGTPPDVLACQQKDLNVVFAQDYGMEEREVVRLLERAYMRTLEEKDDSDEAKELFINKVYSLRGRTA